MGRLLPMIQVGPTSFRGALIDERRVTAEETPESVTPFGNKVMDPTFGTTGVLIRRRGTHRENAIW